MSAPFRFGGMTGDEGSRSTPRAPMKEPYTWSMNESWAWKEGLGDGDHRADR